MAASYAFYQGFHLVNNLFEETLLRANKNDFTTLQELHAISSGMKAVYSWTAHFGLDKIRMSCGGQGFSDYAGIAPLWRHQVLIPTVEGENTMIILQTARFLV